MSDKTKQQIEKEKDAVQAMTKAMSNMKLTLARIDQLEDALRMLCISVEQMKKYLPEYAYSDRECTISLRQQISTASADAKVVLL